MEVIDDLLEVVSLYANPKLTFDVMLMGRGIASRVYLPAYWRRKCIKETMGLMVKDSLVTAQTPLGWYSYYLNRNRTRYGIPRVIYLEVNEQKDIFQDPSPCLSAFDIGQGYVVQLPNYTINIITRHRSSPNYTIVRIGAPDVPGRLLSCEPYIREGERTRYEMDDPYKLFMVFDTGVMYLYQVGEGLVKMDTDVVDVGLTGIVLLRTGEYYELSRMKSPTDVTKRGPWRRAVQLELGYIITPEGNIYYVRDPKTSASRKENKKPVVARHIRPGFRADTDRRKCRSISRYNVVQFFHNIWTWGYILTNDRRFICLKRNDKGCHETSRTLKELVQYASHMIDEGADPERALVLVDV